MTSATPTSGEGIGTLFPLDDFYRRRGASAPGRRLLEAVELPEPHRTLLAHQRDMTGTLERFHGAPLHLRIVGRRQEGAIYWRESVLETDSTNAAVEFGAIRIFLDRFGEPWRGQILEERRPLGAILNESGIAYTSRPSAYFCLEPDAWIASALRIGVPEALFGRQNTLRDASGGVLADIVEILPGEGGKESK
jgi:hypothetical protein